jgi:glycosyl transferase family 1
MRLDGMRVIILGPPWTNCGSYEVFKSQIRAYQYFGAIVDFLAIGEKDDHGLEAEGFWADYYQRSADLGADRLFHTGPAESRRSQLTGQIPSLLSGRFDFAAAAILPSTMSPIPEGLFDHPTPIHHIHCNHFYHMPIARAFAARYSRPILLDTHDVQSHQFALRGERNFNSGELSSVQEMLHSEREQMRDADLLVHLNTDEMRQFQELLPQSRHILLYPHVRELPATQSHARATSDPHAKYVLMVAAPNYPNFLSISWFLSSVYPLLGDVPVRIYGDLQGIFSLKGHALYEKHKSLFFGRVAELRECYGGAFAVALPTTAGYGISIKTIEALTSRLPIVATPLAFRGMECDPRALARTMIAAGAKEFAAALKALYSAQLAPEPTLTHGPALGGHIRPDELYEQFFSFDTYVTGLRNAMRLLPKKKPLREMLQRMFSSLSHDRTVAGRSSS